MTLRYSSRQRRRLNIATKLAGIATLLCGSQVVLNPKLTRFDSDHAPVSRCGVGQDKVAIVYTGTPDRVREGLRLLSERKVCKLLISGVDTREPLPIFLNHFGVPVPPLADISTDTSRNTRENAGNSTEWLAKHPEVREAVLITTDIHMMRSALMMERAMHARGIAIDLKTLSIHDKGFDWKTPISANNVKYIEDWTLERTKLTAAKFGLSSLPWGHLRLPGARSSVRSRTKRYTPITPVIH